MDAWQLVGCKQTMSFAHNTTTELWQNFKPKSAQITGQISANWVNLTQYLPNMFDTFNPNLEFMRWAGVIVNDELQPVADFEKLQVLGGLYAQFEYIGKPADYPETFLWFLNQYCPQNGLKIDGTRPHFEFIDASNSQKELIHIPVITL